MQKTLYKVKNLLYIATGCIMKKKRLNSIDDIAQLAGVSKATVSRALNDSPLVNIHTKDRIRAIAKEHNFLPSCIARNLSNRSSRTVAFVTHAYSFGGCKVSDPFGVELMGGAAIGLHELGYDMLILHVDPRSTEWAAQYLDSGKVDGFILMTSERKRLHIDQLIEMDAPFVAWGDGRGQFNSVRGDDYNGACLAARHFMERGCRNLACIGGPAAEGEVKERIRGFTDTLLNAGLELDPDLVRYGEFKESTGTHAMTELLATGKRFDGVFVCSDIMAASALDVLVKASYRVPEDVALIGYDDLQLASYTRPALTTVSQHVSQAGKVLAKSLVNYLNDRALSTVVMPVELIVRDSA